MLKKISKKIIQLCGDFVYGIGWYARDVIRYRKISGKPQIQTGPFYLFPKIFDKNPSSHTFDKHYVYMDRWAFGRLMQKKAEQHTDVGSSIRFLSMATLVTKVKFVDIRPVNLDFENFECITGSVLQMPFADNSLASLSCLHVAEHIGLGRYGDPLDPEGTRKACAELQRVLAPGGTLYFAGPVGKSATYFNAHRVHDPSTVLNYFSQLRLVSFAGVTDEGHYENSAEIARYETYSYACGMFEFTK